MKSAKRNLSMFLMACIGLTAMSCGGSDDTPAQPPAQEVKTPVAVDDDFTGSEDTELQISGLRDNDNVAAGARITDVASASTQGALVRQERNGTVFYTPKPGFIGGDSFTYTLCLISDASVCSTANVNITIADAGTPEAKDDVVSTVTGATVILSTLLANDTIIDGAKITLLGTASTTGAVTLNADGTVTYVPVAGFEGQDSFTYSLCDNDTPTPTCSVATVTVNIISPVRFNIPSAIAGYYGTASFSGSQALNYDTLSILSVTKHTRILTYGERHEFLYDADADLNNAANVILMYSGESRDEREYTSGNNSHSPQTFNTEHVFPQSLLATENAVTDLHHLRSADDAVNSERLNYPFVDGTGTYKLVNNNLWFPGDEWRGDVARMVLYLNIRYGEDFKKVGTLDLFLKWNREDPVSAFEIQRNEVIARVQGVRNAFIDNPYLITLTYGGAPAENRWE